jgi:hypothetical protein
MGCTSSTDAPEQGQPPSKNRGSGGVDTAAEEAPLHDIAPTAGTAADNPLSTATAKRRSAPCPPSARRTSQQGRPPSAPVRQQGTPKSRPAAASTVVPTLPDFAIPNELGPAIAPIPPTGGGGGGNGFSTFRASSPGPHTPTFSAQGKRSQEALRRRVQLDLQQGSAQLDRMISTHFAAGSFSAGSSAHLAASTREDSASNNTNANPAGTSVTWAP